MGILLLVCILARFAVFSAAIDLWDVSRNGTACLMGRLPMFVYNDTKWEFPNRFTQYAYGFWEIHGACGQQPIGGTLESMWHSDVPNPYIADLKLTLHNISTTTVKRLAGFANAGFLYRPKHKDWLLKIAIKPPGSTYNQFLGEGSFRIVRISESIAKNLTSMSENLDQATVWMNNEENMNDWSGPTPSVPHFDYSGTDCRMYMLSDERVILAFALNPHKNAPSKPYYTELLFWERQPGNESTLYLAVQDIVEMNINVPEQPDLGKTDQKNWIPVEHYDKENNKQQKVLWLSHIWPTNVLEIHIDPWKEWIATATPFHGVWNKKEHVSHCPLPWKYGWSGGGSLHGSSNVVYLPHNGGEYLAFFHVYNQVSKDRVTQTYVMGAYTFKYVEETAESDSNNKNINNEKSSENQNINNNVGDNKGTFVLTGISTTPIIPLDAFYTGRWYHDVRLWGFVDYAMFPVSLVLEGENVFLMYAYQNVHNFITQFRLKDLLHSMERIHCFPLTSSPSVSG